jgi:hypothetical protein
MKCSDVDRMLSEGLTIEQVKAIAADHIQTCDRCAPLLDLVAAPITAPYDEEQSQNRIQSSLRASLEPSRPIGSTPRVVLGIVGVTSGSLLLWTLLMGIPGYSRLDHMRRFALTVYSFVLLILLGVSLSRLMRPAAPKPISPAILLGGVTVGYPVLASLLFPTKPIEEGFVAEGMVCLLFGLITSVASGTMIGTLARRGYVRNGLLTGATLGAISGLTGILALQWVCPDHEGAHIAIWHGLTGVLSIAAGALVGFKRSHAS